MHALVRTHTRRRIAVPALVSLVALGACGVEASLDTSRRDGEAADMAAPVATPAPAAPERATLAVGVLEGKRATGQAGFAAPDASSASVAQATTDLSGSLGGVAITINLRDNTITPADAGVDTDDGVASISGLQALANQVDAAFSRISGGIAKVADMPANSPQGWMGDRRNATQTHVDGFVQLAQANSKTTQTSLTDFINSQISALEGQ